MHLQKVLLRFEIAFTVSFHFLSHSHRPTSEINPIKRQIIHVEMQIYGLELTLLVACAVFVQLSGDVVKVMGDSVSAGR